jgi:integrase
MIRKLPSGKWQADIQSGGRTGVRVKRIFSTQAEAKRFEVWFKAQHAQNLDWSPPKQDRRRLSELLEIWYQEHGCNLSAGLDTYRRLKLLIVDVGDPLAVDFTAAMFSEYRAQRIENGLSKRTLNHELTYLRSMFNELSRLGHWGQDNPLKKLRAYKIQETELSYLTNEEIDRLFASLDLSTNPHTKLITEICLSTGARWSEAEGLTINRVKNGAVLFSRTKTGKTRSIPIDGFLQKMIHEHHSKFGIDSNVFGSAFSAFREAIGRAEIILPSGQLTHVLRHTFASHFMMGGGNILALQRILGHQSLTMTMRYAHLAPEHLEEAIRLNPLEKLRRKNVGSFRRKNRDEPKGSLITD